MTNKFIFNYDNLEYVINLNDFTIRIDGGEHLPMIIEMDIVLMIFIIFLKKNLQK